MAGGGSAGPKMQDLSDDVERLSSAGARDRDAACLSLGNAVLRPSDIETLELGEWIGDAVLAFVFEGLARRLARRLPPSERPYRPDTTLAIWPPSIVELLTSMLGRDIDSSEVGPLASLFPSTASSEIFLLPVSDRYDGLASGQGTHWSLLVLSTPRHPQDGQTSLLTAWHLDSLPPTNFSAAQTVVEAFARLLGVETAELVHLGVGQRQKNASDCGAYVLLGASEFVDNLVASSSPSTGSLEEMLAQIAADLKPAPVAAHRAAMHSWLIRLNRGSSDE